MSGTKISQQDFALKMPGGLLREGGGAYLRDTMVSDYPCCKLTSLNCASRHFVQMLALNSQMHATSVILSYFHVHTAINILRCFGNPREHNFRHPREHNFGLVLIVSPTGCTEGWVYFPQRCRNTHLPHFLDCLLNTTLIPCFSFSRYFTNESAINTAEYKVW